MSYGLFAPGLDIITTGIAPDLKAIDPSLVLVFNKRCYVRPDGAYQGRFEIYDANAPGGPKWQFVKRIQNADGTFRRPDRRDIDDILIARSRPVDQLMKEMEDRADLRERRVRSFIQDTARGFADDLKYIGRRITSSVESRNRTREARKA